MDRLPRNAYPAGEPIHPSPAVLSGARSVLRQSSWSPERLAYWMHLDPALCAWLLTVWARASGTKAGFVSLRDCVAQVGRPLLHALLHGLPGADAGDRSASGQWRQALFLAAVTRRLALATKYPRPEEAYLAGLFCHLDAEAVAAAGVGPLVVDAIRYRRRPLRELASAHPLLGIVGAAAWAVDQAESWPAAEAVAEAAALVGLRTAEFTAEVARGRKWTHGIKQRLRSLGPQPCPPADAAEPIAVAGRLQPLQESWFLLDAPLELRAEVVRAARIMFGCTNALLMVPDADGRRLQISPDDSLPAAAGELFMDLEQVDSAVVAAFRSAKGPRVVAVETTDDLPVAGRQIMGLLGGRDALCVPLPATGQGPVALLILGNPGGRLPSAADQTLIQFAEFAGSVLSACQLRHDRLRRSQDEQREALHQRVRHVRHDVGNSLSIIKNYLTILGERTDAGPDGETRIIGEEIDRVASMLSELSLPAAVAQVGPVDINRLVRDTVSRGGSAIFAAKSVAPAMEFDPRLPTVVTDALALRQALLNLYRNATEAMAEGGSLSVSTAAVNLAGRMFAEITVRDSGPGIRTDRMADVFHPVPTGKGFGHEGLGLSIVRANVARLGGEVFFRNVRDGGAEFSILIPWQPDESAVRGQSEGT